MRGVAVRTRTPIFKPFTPFGTPPPDRYDPALDFQLAAGERGLGDTVTDAATAGRRGVEDYGFGVSDLQRTQGRGLADIGQQRGYENEDYNRNVGLLTRQYGRLGGQQNEQARVMGVQGGGALVQAARKRTENMAVDRQGLDTAHNRALTGFDTATSRLNEDTGTGIARLGVGLERGMSDRGLGVQRAGREQVFLGLDTARARQAQAQATGWDPGPKPVNEFGGALGPHHVIVRGNTVYGVDPAGKVIFKRPKAR